MTDPEAATHDQPQVIEEQRSYIDVLHDMVGKQVTVVNPESYEALPKGGSELREGIYSGVIAGFGSDYFIFDTILTETSLIEFVTEADIRVGRAQAQPGDDESVPSVRQYIPIARIKRLSVVGEGVTVLLHL